MIVNLVVSEDVDEKSKEVNIHIEVGDYVEIFMVPFDYVIIKPILSDLQDMVVAHVDDETVVVHNKVLNLIGNVYINLIDGMRIGIEHCRVIDVFEVIYVDAENAEEDLWEVRTEINR